MYSGHSDTSYVSDLVQGFPVTGSLPSGGNGITIPGGQRVHGKPGLGGPNDLNELRQECGARNRSTLKAAQVPTTPQEFQLAEETWTKLQQDITNGYIGEPVDIETLDLENILLVDSFGVWENTQEQIGKLG